MQAMIMRVAQLSKKQMEKVDTLLKYDSSEEE